MKVTASATVPTTRADRALPAVAASPGSRRGTGPLPRPGGWLHHGGPGPVRRGPGVQGQRPGGDARPASARRCPVSAPVAPLARSLPEICEDVRQVNCGECWQVPGTPCTPGGDHVARFGRAMRRGLISGPRPGRGPGDARRVHHRDRDPRRPGRCAVRPRSGYDEVAEMPLADVLNRYQALDGPRLDGPLHRHPEGPWHVPSEAYIERGAFPPLTVAEQLELIALGGAGPLLPASALCIRGAAGASWEQIAAAAGTRPMRTGGLRRVGRGAAPAAAGLPGRHHRPGRRRVRRRDEAAAGATDAGGAQ